MISAALSLLCLGTVAADAPPGDTPPVFGQPVVQTFEGVVTHLRRTDTFELLVDGETVVVRLAGVHGLEASQRFASSAEQIATRVVEGQQVTVRAVTPLSYGFCVGDLDLRGRSVAKSLVSAGLVWQYETMCDDAELAALQASARRHGRGLWKESAPVAPWVVAKQTAEARRNEKEQELAAKLARRTAKPLARVASLPRQSGAVLGSGRPLQRRNRDHSVFDSRGDATLYR